MLKLNWSLTTCLALPCFLLPVLILAWIWISEFRHYYVPNERIEDTVLEECRLSPSDSVLEEIRGYRLFAVKWKDNNQLIAAAEKLLHGSVELPGYVSDQIHLPFAPADLERGSGLWQIYFAGLAVPQMLLDAYRVTGREDFWIAARESILAWAQYDRSAWVNRGSLWDDHALAVRVQTLADFWSMYRRRPDYRPDVARTVLEFVARTGERLSKPDFFTFATNHGVMENVGLWHLCIAFPSLPHAELYRQLALTRLNEQMGFYIGQEGVVLEHSLAYHEFGLRLLGMALRYATLLNSHVPREWVSKYDAAKAFYAEIQRPDGMLPRLGDTPAENVSTQVTQVDSEGRAGPLGSGHAWEPAAAFQVYPVAGYAVLWDGLSGWPKEQDLSQTVLTWSYFEGHGHKHADELSVIFWAGGLEWWTNAGFWSSDGPDWAHAQCWEGSDAPHLADEPCQSSRVSSLVSTFEGKDLAAVEAERKGPGNLIVRRQVLQVAPKIWIVIDDASGAPQKRLQTIWTTEPNVSLNRASSLAAFTLSAPNGKQRMRAWFLGPPTMSTRVFHGNRKPFVGWLSLNGEPKATEAILTEQPAEHGWAVTIWALGGGDPSRDSNMSGTPQVLQWTNGEDWHISLPLAGGVKEISRLGNTLTMYGTQAGAKGETAILVSAPDLSQQRAELRDNFQAVAARYPRFRELRRYKLRVTYVTLLALAFQEMFLLAYWQRRGRGAAVLRSVAILAWFGWGTWLRFFYFFLG